jgi:Zn-dependent peptidase ImmA (M78 family)
LTKKIKIGSIYYKLTYCSVVDEDGNKMAGLANHNEAEIKIDDSLSEQAGRQTLLHEVLHAMLLQTGTSMSESRIDALAFQLYGFIRENHALIQEIME